MTDTRDNDRSILRLAAVLLAAVLLTFGAACGGGDESADAPAAEAPDAAPAADPGAAAADLEPGNAAVAELGDGTATISGTITFAGTAPSLRPVAMDADPACASKHQGPVENQILLLGDGNTLGNVFVKINSGLAEKQWPAPSEPAVIDQEGCVYHPHVMGVMAGQTLAFLNSDGLLHNVHGLPEVNRDFNIGMPPTVTRSDWTLEQPEPLFEVKCDVHPWMQSYVAVMSHPYFDVTGEDGRFEIRNVPAGTYEIEAWHERLGTQTATVTVEDGGSATSDLTFSTPQS